MQYVKIFTVSCSGYKWVGLNSNLSKAKINVTKCIIIYLKQLNFGWQRNFMPWYTKHHCLVACICKRNKCPFGGRQRSYEWHIAFFIRTPPVEDQKLQPPYTLEFQAYFCKNPWKLMAFRGGCLEFHVFFLSMTLGNAYFHMTRNSTMNKLISPGFPCPFLSDPLETCGL